MPNCLAVAYKKSNALSRRVLGVVVDRVSPTFDLHSLMYKTGRKVFI